jgi:hypothetical protein
MSYKTVGARGTYFLTPASSTTAVQIATGVGVIHAILNASATAQTNAMSLYDSASTTVSGLVPLLTIKAQLLPVLLAQGSFTGIEFSQGLVATFASTGTNSDGGPTIVYGGPILDKVIERTNVGNRGSVEGGQNTSSNQSTPASSSASVLVASGKTILYGITNADAAAQSNAMKIYDLATTTIGSATPVMTITAPANTPTFITGGGFAGVEFLNGIVVTFAGNTNTGGGPGIICGQPVI